MWLAYFLIGYILFVSFLFYSGDNNTYSSIKREKLAFKDGVFLTLTFGLLCFLAIFRGEHVGSDTSSYVVLFRVFESSNKYMYAIVQTRMEPGFVLFVKLLTYMSKSPQIIIIVSSCIIMFSILRFFIKYSKCLWMSVFFFFCIFYDSSLNIMRQYLALSILLWAYDYIQKRDFLKFLLLVILSTTFHYTAFFFIIAYSFQTFKINRNTITKFFLLFPFGIAGSFVLLMPLLSLAHILGFYGYYNDSNKYLTEGVKIATILKVLLHGLTIYIGVRVWNLMKYTDESKELENGDRLPFLFCMLGCFITACSLPFNVLSRVGLYFLFFSCLFLPSTLCKILERKNGLDIVSIFVIIYICYYLIVNTFRPEWTNVYPYNFYQ